MLSILTTRDYSDTLRPLWKYLPRSRRPHCRSYEWLFRQRTIPGGTWVFTDIERLSPLELSNAALAATALEAGGSRVLNHPARVLCRSDLLARLHAEGINRFRAYPAAVMPKPHQFPVLLKSETDHRQPYRELYNSEAELHGALERLMKQGVPLRDMLVIEFCAAPIREGVYRKHSVFRVADAFLSHTIVIENDWAVKYGTAGLSTDSELQAAVLEMETNPHRELMHRVFRIAGIEYGRSDFGFTPEGVAVYEINTNPVVPGRLKLHRMPAYRDACNRAAERIRSAIADLPRDDAPPVRMPWAKLIKLRFDFGFRYRVRRP